MKELSNPIGIISAFQFVTLLLHQEYINGTCIKNASRAPEINVHYKEKVT